MIILYHTKIPQWHKLLKPKCNTERKKLLLGKLTRQMENIEFY